MKVSTKLATMLKNLPKDSPKVFGNVALDSLRCNFNCQRKRIAKKLCNPRIQRITFHTLRHWKATMEYHKTKDILHVKQLLAYRNINSTMLYTQLINFESDEYHVKVAKKVKEACDLVEAGFEYVCDIEGAKLFRKRK